MKKIQTKAIISISIVLVIIGGLFYNKKVERQKTLQEIYINRVYSTVSPIEPIDAIPIITEKDLEIVLANPPLLKIDGDDGLYVAYACYQYFTKIEFDYLNIQNKIEEGEILEAYYENKEFFDWLNSNKQKKETYYDALLHVAIFNGDFLNRNDSYLRYEKIIQTYPDEIKKYLERSEESMIAKKKQPLLYELANVNPDFVSQYGKLTEFSSYEAYLAAIELYENSQ